MLVAVLQTSPFRLRNHCTSSTNVNTGAQVPEAGRSAREVLHEEYVSSVRTHGRQPKAGHKGQAHAVWEHDVPEEDVRRVKSGGGVTGSTMCHAAHTVHAVQRLRTHAHTRTPTRTHAGGFPIWFIHGRKDLVAMPDRAERLARRFGAPCVMLQGAHFIPRENAGEVAELLRSIVRNHVRLHAAHAKCVCVWGPTLCGRGGAHVPLRLLWLSVFLSCLCWPNSPCVRVRTCTPARLPRSPADAMQLRVGTSSQGQEKEAGQLQLVLSATTSGPAGAAASS